MMSLSYWMKIEAPDKSIVWEGMVYGRIVDDVLQIDAQETDQEFFRMARTAPNLTFMWEPVWKDVTEEYMLKESHDTSSNQ